MKSTKKSGPNLSVGSTFLLHGFGQRYPAQLKVLSRRGEKVRVKFSTPASPKVCPKCHHGFNLSVHGVTGVVECMTTGCGHHFGYTPVATKMLEVSDFAGLMKSDDSDRELLLASA